MPKFLYGKIVVRTFVTYAENEIQGREYIRKWQEDENEEPEGGIKATSYKIFWEEFDETDPTSKRDQVLAAFLELMQKKIPGIPVTIPVEKSNIIRPFDKG